jgi:hypothetical protein
VWARCASLASAATLAVTVLAERGESSDEPCQGVDSRVFTLLPGIAIVEACFGAIVLRRSLLTVLTLLSFAGSTANLCVCDGVVVFGLGPSRSYHTT